jgi:hypothetical protein
MTNWHILKKLRRYEPRYPDVIAEVMSIGRNETSKFAAAALDQFF